MTHVINASIQALKVEAQTLRAERDAAELKAKQAQRCLELIHHRLGELELLRDCDTPLADSYGG